MKTPIDYDTDLKRFSFHLTRDKHKANDLLQTTYLRAYRSLESFDGRNMKSWLITIMKNEFINQYRVKQRVHMVELDNFNGSCNDAESLLTVNEIEAHVNRISEKLKDTINLHRFGFKYHEIADHMGIDISTVKRRIHMAKNKLKIIS